MDGLYLFMRKDEPLTMIRLDNHGHIVNQSDKVRHSELLPLSVKDNAENISDWWSRRSVPVGQDGIEQILKKSGYTDPAEYLTGNLGLSLTDYYWIKPVDSDLSWRKVNLFANDFTSDHLLAEPAPSDKDTIPHYSPNASLQGNIEKTWSIINGRRCLVKGCRGTLSTESLNEVFVSEIYRTQGYDNYTEYSLLRIPEKGYDYGCYSENFASEKLEFVSAYDIVSSEKKPNDKSTYEHFIDICGKHGIDKDMLRNDLEMQILTDFVVSGHDRHLNNLGILRNSDTLEFERMAPVFDSGEAFFTGRSFPRSEKDLLSLKINSFCATEKDMIAKVREKGLLDAGKLPSSSQLLDLYEKDTKAAPAYTRSVKNVYEAKIEMLLSLQKGKDPFRRLHEKLLFN